MEILKKYKKRCRKAHLRTNGLCTVCLLNKSEQIHHSSYRKSAIAMELIFFLYVSTAILMYATVPKIGLQAQ